MQIKTTHAAYLFTLSIIIYALGLFYFYGFSNYFIIIPGWHIQFHIIYFYIGCFVTGAVNFLLYRKFAKRSPLMKVKRLLLHILITVPLWMIFRLIQFEQIRHQFGEMSVYYSRHDFVKSFSSSLFLMVIIQFYYWRYAFKAKEAHTSRKKNPK